MGRRAGLVTAAFAALVAAMLATGVAAGDGDGQGARRRRARPAPWAGRAGGPAGRSHRGAERGRGARARAPGSVDAQRARLSVLEGRLSQARDRLAVPRPDDREADGALERLRGEYRIALTRLEQRVRELYMTDGPDVLSFVLGTSRSSTSSTTSNCSPGSGDRTSGLRRA